ncbi:Dicarboxylate transport [Halopseudomonas litoralis]|uniref:Dicarboxylate transport n=1 Tax=Halopseudomonas litoralis TaxID=797277 RepID=A0A1H1VWH6_9GAMM|nr:YdbH domain-containing protein [Halopseudomonas litoralis]SDS88399.1 Dicarboxylate transport [Halopseudomonas litoralis]
MRKAAISAGAVLLLVLLAVLLAGLWVQRALTAAGFEQLHWQQLRWSEGAVQVKQLNGVNVSEQGRLDFRLDGVRLRPVWDGGPRIDQLVVDELQLVWEPRDNLPPSEPTDDWSLPELDHFAGPLSWLPRELEVRHMQLQLPCEGEFCVLQGGFQLTTDQQPLALVAQLYLQADEQSLSGSLQLHEESGGYRLLAGLDLPQSLHLLGLGQLSGKVRVDLENRGSQWLLREGQADARLLQPQLDALAVLPPELRPSALMVWITPQASSLNTWRESISFAMQLQIEGAVAGQVDAQLALNHLPHWQVQLHAGRLQLNADKLELEGMQLQTVQLDWPFQAEADQNQLNLLLNEGALLTTKSLSLTDACLQLSDLRADLSKATLNLPFSAPDQLKLEAPLQLGASRLTHAALKPQGWNLSGRLQHSSSGLMLNGSLAALSGLNTDLQLNWPTGEAWRLDMTLREIFLRAADPLAATFADWPALLSFSSGRISSTLQASGRSGLDRIKGQLELTGGQGIYDRASFSGLSLPLTVSLQGKMLQLSTDALNLSALDPGLPLGPLRASGTYTAQLSKPSSGALELRSASLGVLDGRVLLEPARVDMGQARQTLVAVVEGVELARLFEVYPAEGLSGQGTLDGRFPISLANGKLQIDDGRLQAREPGVLRYQAQQLRDLAATNPGMEQLALALDNFHYQVLASDLSYDEQGVLVLGLRLEGSNPAFQQGRPVHLNIRLEEDIPALLTSLQLSGQVSEIIRKRVEQYYLQRRSP